MNHEQDFTQIVSDSGIPTTEAEAKAAWQQELNDAEITIENNSPYSPFWRIVTTLVTKPLMWLVNDLLIKSVLPNCFLKTATGKWLDIIAWGYEVTRKEAVKTQGVLQLNRVNTEQALEIAAGSVILSKTLNNTVYRFKTLDVQNFNEGADAIDILVEAENIGKAYNLGILSFDRLEEDIEGVTVSNVADWITRLGADIETNDELRLRCRNQFTAVTSYHTDAVYISLVTQFGGIGVENIRIEHNAPRGAGTANIHILPDVGQVDPQFLNDVEYKIMDEGNHGLGDDVELQAMPETHHDISVDLWAKAEATDEQKQEVFNNVETFIRCAFRENNSYPQATRTQPFSLFSFSKLEGELHSTFALLENARFSSSGIVSELSIPRLQSLTVSEGSYD